MSGPVEWAVLIFLSGLAGGSMYIAWAARGVLARYELKYDLAIASLVNAIQDRNFLLKYDLALAENEKDIRHTKKNLEQHSTIYAEMHDNMIRTQAELNRLGKLVNGKH